MSSLCLFRNLGWERVDYKLTVKETAGNLAVSTGSNFSRWKSRPVWSTPIFLADSSYSTNFIEFSGHKLWLCVDRDQRSFQNFEPWREGRANMRHTASSPQVCLPSPLLSWFEILKMTGGPVSMNQSFGHPKCWKWIRELESHTCKHFRI